MRPTRLVKTGFSLIELLVVATIIIVLSGIGTISYSRSGRQSRDAKRKTDLEVVKQALVLYRSDNGCYPPGNYASLATSLDGYIDSLPSDPKGGTYTYTAAGVGNCQTTQATGFTLSTTLELTETAYEVSNP